jgi:hypothetical protein
MLQSTPQHLQTQVGSVKNGGNGHRRRVRAQIHGGYRRAALKASTAVMLVEITGMPVAEAIERCSTTTSDFYAMKVLKESGNVALYNHVLKGNEPVRAAGKRVENAAAAITAFKKCSVLERGLFRLATGATSDPVTMLRNLTPEQLVATANALSPAWIWDKLIEPAMSTEPATGTKETVLADPAIRDVT